MPNKKTSYENFSNGAQYGCTYAPFEGLAVCLRSTIFSIAIIAIMPHTEKIPPRGRSIVPLKDRMDL